MVASDPDGLLLKEGICPELYDADIVIVGVIGGTIEPVRS